MAPVKPITRREIDALIAPGYVIAVTYLKRDLTAEVIAFGEEGEATHALCCRGGLDIYEATALGVYETNLHNYLRANCRLTVRRSKAVPFPSWEQAKKATDYWDARVLDPYAWSMIFGSIPILFAHKVIGLFSKRLADVVVRMMPNLLASSTLSTCAEIGGRGIRQFDPVVFVKWFLDSVNPEIMRTDDSLETVIILDGMTLID
jgi:hypothetical protein